MKFYYIDDITGQQCGPFDLQQLRTKNIRPDTMVWRPGMPDWKKAETVDDLKYLFEPKFQPPPIYERQNPPIEDKTPPNEQNQDKWNGILPMPKNWLIESIVLSVVCCSPVSMVGIYYALKVETRYSAIRQKIMKVL